MKVITNILISILSCELAESVWFSLPTSRILSILTSTLVSFAETNKLKQKSTGKDTFFINLNIFVLP